MDFPLFGGENTRVRLRLVGDIMNPFEEDDHEIQLSEKILVTKPGLMSERENQANLDNHLHHGSTTTKSNVLPRKIAPHMRRLNIRVTSPSDNLSPFSQKLMAADRHNSALKTLKPKSLKEVLLSSSKPHGSDRFASTIADVDNSMMDIDQSIEEQQPSSPSKHKGSKMADRL